MRNGVWGGGGDALTRLLCSPLSRHFIGPLSLGAWVGWHRGWVWVQPPLTLPISRPQSSAMKQTQLHYYPHDMVYNRRHYCITLSCHSVCIVYTVWGMMCVCVWVIHTYIQLYIAYVPYFIFSLKKRICTSYCVKICHLSH